MNAKCLEKSLHDICTASVKKNWHNRLRAVAVNDVLTQPVAAVPNSEVGD